MYDRINMGQAASSGQILGVGTQYEGLGNAIGQKQDLRGIPQALQRLRTAASEVGMCVDGLRTRLDPVMAPQVPEPAKVTGTSVLSTCAVCEDINTTATELLHMVDAMRSYMQRLEV